MVFSRYFGAMSGGACGEILYSKQSFPSGVNVRLDDSMRIERLKTGHFINSLVVYMVDDLYTSWYS